MTFERPEAPTEDRPRLRSRPSPTEAPPTEAPTELPTEAPTEAPEPTQAPTEAPAKAIVNIYDIFGNLNETKEFDIDDTFTVYTVLNASDINDGKIAAISGSQTYTDSVVALADAVDGEGAITDLAKVFPITGDKSLGNAANSGVIYFNASNPSIDDPFVFDSNDDVIIATTYTVTAGGTADIKTTLKTLASADEDLTQIISKGEIKDDKLGEGDEYMTFDQPVAPTEARLSRPTEPD